MKNVYHTLGMVAVFLSVIVPNAFATTGIISSDSVHAEKFSFYCGPYKRSFEDGKHYVVDNTTCFYSIPNTLSGNKRVNLYKGTPGVSATTIGGDLVTHGGTLISQTPNIFSAPSNEDPFFAVIYEASLDQGSTPLHAYLSGATSTLPAAVVEGQNFYIIPWKWGPKPVEEFEPLLVVPDTLTSWATDEGFVLDPVFNTYQNLLDTLEANGYVPGQTLFTLPYDWEHSYDTLADAITNKIADIKSTCGCAFVDVLTYGMSSLAAARYLEDSGYQHDIDQVVFVGGPFNGVPGAYAAWEAGLVQFDEPLRNGVAQSLLAHRAAVGGFSSVFDYVQNSPVTSFLEMLPVTNYLSGKTYPTGYPQNTLLEEVQDNFGVLLGRTAQLHQFDSNSTTANTPNSFTVALSAELPLWPHGKPTATQLAKGDTMVPFLSAEFLWSSDLPINNVTHHDLPTETADEVFAALNGAPPTIIVDNSYSTNCVLFLTVSQGTDLQVLDPGGNRLGKNFTGGNNYAEIERSVYSGPSTPAEYLAIANPFEGIYEVRTQGNASGSFTLTATDVCNGSSHSTSTTANTTPGQIVGYNVTVTEDNELELEALDTTAPIIVIHTPTEGATYLSSDSVTPSVTVTDPDGSPIGDITYTLNGNIIDPLLPLPLSSQPLGAAVFAVSSIDIFGNEGLASTTFTIEAPASPASDDCLLALHPNKKAAFKLGSSADVTASDCALHINSSAQGALDLSGSAELVTTSTCVVGTVKKSGSAKMTPGVTTPCTPKADPYATHTKPAVGACDHTNLKVNGSQTRTLEPGVYCGGLDVSGSVKVTLNPGLYIIKNGDLNINGSAKVTGNGVSFFLTGSGAAFNFSGSAEVKLSAMTSGVLQGFVFFLDSASNTANKSEINGSVKTLLNGTVYLPEQELRIGGSSDTLSPTPTTTYIADTFYLNGSAKLNTKGSE